MPIVILMSILCEKEWEIARYLGWVKEHKAKDGEKVSGIIIVGEKDKKLEYALKGQENIKALIYEIDFNLKFYQS